MQRLLISVSRCSGEALCSLVAAVVFGASASLGVPIDLTDATPTVTGATSLHIDGISTLGSNYWADFKWNPATNKFDVSGYGEEMGPPKGFLLVEAGKFVMGSPADEPGRSSDEDPHTVILSRDFYLQETEVTQAQWVSLMGSNPSFHEHCDECPVEYITWHEAVGYCNALSDLEGLSRAYEMSADSVVTWAQSADGYRLPTEAEWEYACRAGSTTAFYNGEISQVDCDPVDPKLDTIGWYCGNNVPYGTKEVGLKLPNPWGFYDMSGNVYEWCWDFHGDYPAEFVEDPAGPESGTMRVDRGGAWNNSARNSRSAARGREHPSNFERNIGFRPARWLP